MRSQKLGEYYLIGSPSTSGSMIFHTKAFINGDGTLLMKSNSNYGLTFSEIPFIGITPLGTQTPFDYFSSGLDAAYELKSGSTDQEKLSMGFKTGGSSMYIDGVAMLLSKQGSPAGTIYADIYADSGGVPTGGVLGSSTGLTANTVITSTYASFGYVFFQFASPVSLSANTNYHIVLRASGYTYSGGATAIWWAGDGSSPSHPNGYAGKYNSGTSAWSAISGMAFYFYTYERYTDAYDTTDIASTDDVFFGMVEDPTTTSCIVAITMPYALNYSYDGGGHITGVSYLNTFALNKRYLFEIICFGAI